MDTLKSHPAEPLLLSKEPTVQELTYLEAICIPLVRKTALRTELVCPSKVLMQLQFPMAHNLTVLSPEAVTTH